MSLARRHTGFSFAINLLGKIWTAVFSIIFVSKFGSILGAEAYGLATVQVLIMSVSVLFDLGLSTGITHRLARVDTGLASEVKQARNLLRSFEALYLITSILICVIIVLSAPFIARHWLELETMSVETATLGLRIVGVFALFQFSQALYVGALTGLYKPDYVNIARGLQVTAQNVGAFLLIRFWLPSVHVFLGWMAFVAALTFFGMRWLTWKELASPDGSRARFESVHLRENFVYFKGLTFFSFWGIVVGNADRLIVSKFLPLTQFGFYQFAAQLVNALQFIGQPFYASIFPKLSRLHQERDAEAAGRFYMRASGMLATLIVPVGIAFAIFAEQVFIVSGANPEYVLHAAPIFSLLSLGTTLNVLMLPALAFQLSHEWLRLSTLKNILAAAFYLPLMYLSVKNYGTLGAASCWILLNFSYICFELPLMHKRLMPGRLWTWYRSCLLLPLLVCCAVLLPLKYGIDSLNLTRAPLGLALCAAGSFALVAVALSQRETRAALAENFAKIPAIWRELEGRKKRPH